MICQFLHFRDLSSNPDSLFNAQYCYKKPPGIRISGPTFVLQFVVHSVLDLPTINSNFQCLFIFCLGIQNLYNSTVSDFNMYYIIYTFIDVSNIREHIESTFINIKIERWDASFLSSFVSGKSSVIPIQFIFHYLFDHNFLKALTDIHSIYYIFFELYARRPVLRWIGYVNSAHAQSILFFLQTFDGPRWILSVGCREPLRSVCSPNYVNKIVRCVA